MELEWLTKSLGCSDVRELPKLLDHDHPELSVSRRCALPGLPRSMLYYRPTPVRESMLQIMASIDALYMEDPCSGSRRMVGYLARDGIPINLGRVRNLIRGMRLRAIYQKPSTQIPGDLSERFPCLVGLGLVTAMNQAWAMGFQFDASAVGRRIKCLNVIDEQGRFCLAIRFGRPCKAKDVVAVLEVLSSLYPASRFIRSDNGPEIIANALRWWCQSRGTITATI